MTKFTIMFVPSDNAGCGYYRMIQPGRKLGEYTDINVIIHHQPTIEDLDGVDILVTQRTRMHQDDKQGMVDLNHPLMLAAKDKGIKLVYDNDDNDIALPTHHGLFHSYKEHGIPEKIKANLALADYATTTTPYLRDRLFEHGGGGKVYVFPNCLDWVEPMWRYPRITSPVTYVGWAGGSSHLKDISLLRNVFSTMYKQYGPDVVYCIGGFDIRGTYAYQDELGNLTQRKMEEHETVWNAMRDVLLSDIPADGQRILRALPISEYGWLYSHFDVGVVPLEDDEFNRSKSELKLLEFGAYGVASVVSSAQPYTFAMEGNEDIVEWVSANPSTIEWTKALAPLIEDPMLRDHKGHLLHKFIRARYDATAWNPARRKFYEAIMEGDPDHPDPVQEIPRWDDFREWEPEPQLNAPRTAAWA